LWVRSLRYHWVSLDFDFDVGSLLELNLPPMIVRQSVRNPNFSVKVISALHRDLGFFRLAGTGMRGDNFFDFPRQRGGCFRFFLRHKCGPPLGQTKHTTKEGVAIAGTTAPKKLLSK
jgi:hypothetical protein